MKSIFWFVASTAISVNSLSNAIEDLKVLYEDHAIQLVRSSEDQSVLLISKRDRVVLAEVPGDLQREVSVRTAVDDRVTICLIQNPESGETITQMFLHREAGVHELLIDLNSDGSWDVRKGTATGNEIFHGGTWEKIEKFNGVYTIRPTATMGEKVFAFNGTWELLNNVTPKDSANH